MRGLSSFLDTIHIALPALLIALTFHEFAHAKVADLLGDPTSRRAGRLTLNPIDHMDPMGTLMMVFVGFGWARPVPINPFNFRGDRNRGILLVSLAGPMANLVLAFISVILFYAVIIFSPGVNSITNYLIPFFQSLVMYNIFLMLFNLIPIPPLDGSKVLTSLLPQEMRYRYDQMEQYAPFILILLLISGLIPRLLSPVAYGIIGVIESIVVPIFNIFL